MNELRVMPCPSCRTMLPQDARFCAACGTNLDARRGAHTVVLARTEIEVRIGRDASNTIRIQNDLISKFHAVIRVVDADGQRWLELEDLRSTHGTQVNGQRIDRATKVSLTDDVRLGSVALSLVHPSIVCLLIQTGKPQADDTFIVGRSPSCALVIDDSRVAAEHIRCRFVDPMAASQSNVEVFAVGAPFALDTPNFMVRHAIVPPFGKLILNGVSIPVEALVVAKTGVDRNAGVQIAEMAATATFTIGREPPADVVLLHPSLSGVHARITQDQGGCWVEDLGSANGTFINGDRIAPHAQTWLVTGGILQLGQQLVRFASEERAGVGQTIALREIEVTVGTPSQPKVLLSNVNMTIFPGELVAMLGPSGAGKSTLLMAILGTRSVSAGTILLDGRPRDRFALFGMGYVPQDDIVHGTLTVYEALYYAHRLRIGELPLPEMDARIKRTLQEVGLYAQRHTRIGSPEEKTLSGGQRRRVNLAVELVIDPAVLLLDEPTSGLSWTDAAEVVGTLKRLAQSGRTILLTIHQPDFREYDKFDCVAILGNGGRLLFFGPPNPQSYLFFGANLSRPREIFDHVEQLDPQEWQQRFLRSETYREYVHDRDTEAVQAAPGLNASSPRPSRASAWTQFSAVVSRSVKLTLRQRTALLLLLIQAPLVGVLIGLTAQGAISFRSGNFGCKDASYAVETCAEHADDAPFLCPASTAGASRASRSTIPPTREQAHILGVHVRDPRTALLAMLMALFLPMVIAGSNVLVSERTVFERERLAGLRIAPYVVGRYLVLMALGVVVASLHLAVALPWLGLAGPPILYVAVGILVTSVATAMGMALSAAVRSPVSALWGINFMVIPQLLFAGSITRLSGVVDLLSRLTITRYALDVLARGDLENRGSLPDCALHRWLHNYPGFAQDLAHPWLTVAGASFTMIVASLGIASFFLWERTRIAA